MGLLAAIGQVLVEKDWVSFGHKFADRCGFDHDDGYESHERSPIFFQFIDCIRMIATQFPWAFEYNEAFLAFVADACFSDWFTTLSRNTEQQRSKDRFINGDALPVLWDAVHAQLDAFTNVVYHHQPAGVLYPSPPPSAQPVGAAGAGTAAASAPAPAHSEALFRLWKPSCVLIPATSLRVLTLWDSYIHGWFGETRRLTRRQWRTFRPRPNVPRDDVATAISTASGATGGVGSGQPGGGGGAASTAAAPAPAVVGKGRHLGLTLGVSVAPKGGASHCSLCHAEFFVVIRPKRLCKQCHRHVCVVRVLMALTGAFGWYVSRHRLKCE